MSQPPPPGPWGPTPQQPGGWQQPGSQPQWGPQQPWPAQSPKKSGPFKWILGAVALLVIIAVTAVVTVSCAGDGGNGATGPTSTSETTSGAPSEFASANDTGPVSVITEDPSCAPWIPISNTLSDVEKKGWSRRDASIPADVWTPEIRAQYLDVAWAMNNAADQTELLTKITPHRVMRELYEQFIVFARAYANEVPTYTPVDEELALTVNAVSAVIVNVCSSVSSSSAAARAPLISPGIPPTTIAPVGDVNDLSSFMKVADPLCTEFIAAIDQFANDPVAVNWFNTADSNVPAGQWTPEQRSVSEAVVPVLQSSADRFEQLAERSTNAVAQDFAALTAVYRRAFAAAIPNYSVADQYLYSAGRYAPGILQGACIVAGSG